MYSTDFLVAKKGFISGMSRVLDLSSAKNKKSYNTSLSVEEADRKALKNDWLMVGQDLYGAMNEFEQKYKQ